MMSWSESVVLFLLLVSQSIVSGINSHLTVKTIVVPNKTDRDVVDEVVNIITRNCIFPDQFFLQRLAIVESTDIRDIKTQTLIKYDGGIWKVDRNKFQQTKSLQHVLKPVHEQIRKKLNINWDQVRWSDLKNPLYSGLAAALYILLNTGKKGIPSQISEQALLWKTIYRPSASTSIFLERVHKLKLGSTLPGKHNQTFLCGDYTRNNNNVEADSKNNTEHIGNTHAKGAQKPTKTPFLHFSTVLRRIGINIDDKKQLNNKGSHIGYKMEDILNILCTQKAIKEQRKFPHPSDRNKYMICNEISAYSIRNCQDEKYFSVSQQACTQADCDIPIWVNQKETATLDKSYPNPCKIDIERVCNLIFVSHLHDPTKFIQCDKMGNAIIKTCPIDWIWSNQRKACFYRDKNQTMKACTMPIWDNPNEVGAALPVFYPNPCKVDGTRTCDYIYVANLMDIHKFIRCDRLGQALIKSCPISSKWNTALNTCTSVDVITTPKPQCPIPVWDNPKEVGTALPAFYVNPCKVDGTRNCDYIYVANLMDIHKFIRCDRLGQALIKSCPISSKWNTALNTCTSVDVITTPKPQCPIPVWDNPKEVGAALPEFYVNPCKVDGTRNCDYIYVANLMDIHKFIRCDRLGQALIKSCPISSKWNTALNTCTSVDVITTPKPQCPIPVWDNPKEVGTALPEFYVNPCKVDGTRTCDYIYVVNLMDIHKFIRCDRLGQALIKSCPISSKWNTALNACTSVDVITTPKPQCPIPVWDNPKEVGTALPEFYVNPCKVDGTRTCDYIYVVNLMDIHKFIRCDRLGQALIKSCPISSKWNTALNACTSVDIITTPKPQCPIPVWDNPKEVGTALPEFYVNPCKVDGTRTCDYIYVVNLMDIHKFIRCDRLGQALIKSCPISSKWNTALNACSSVDVITTPKPQCPIPVWDNPKEVGIALPDFYPNPCNPDSGRTCDYIYLNHILDDHKFIRCDRLGQAIVKSCPISSKWNTELSTCTSVDVITTPKPQCPIPVWDNPNDVGAALPDFYPNPCNPDSGRTCDYIYLNHILDDHKFIRCDRLGQAIVKSCPISSKWNIALNTCTSVDVITTPKPQCPIPVWDNPKEVGTALPEFYVNPCKVDGTRTCDYIYVANLMDIHKFIRCDRLGQALIKSCPISSKWNTALNACTSVDIITTPKPQCPIPVWDNPNDVGAALPDFYPNPCNPDSGRTCNYTYLNYIFDDHKFIRCDRLGKAIVKSCPTSSKWNTALNTCTSVDVIITPIPVITTIKPQCPIPVWDNPNDVGAALPDFYPNPCNPDSGRTCDYIYLNHILDDHKFIRCDRLGQAIVKSCPISSKWNTELSTCTSVDVITTPKPQCPIPVWDNPNDVGAALPDFYPNPCIPDSGRTCDYIYLNHILDDHKFIRCDRLGKAIVKSCPTSSKWNTELSTCTSVDIITTPKSQCPIPVWDNPNEAGTPLPDYYPNPCKKDELRLCQFIYLDFALNDHKFIQCDRTGKALIKSCPASQVWNSTKKQC